MHVCAFWLSLASFWLPMVPCRPCVALTMKVTKIMNHAKSSNIESLPVIFDDILVNSDLERSSKIIDTLSEVSEENQIIYFTFNPVVVEGFSKLGRQCEIIEL